MNEIRKLAKRSFVGLISALRKPVGFRRRRPAGGLRPHVMAAYQASLKRYASLYKKLAD
jgi:hypothetical protein